MRTRAPFTLDELLVVVAIIPLDHKPLAWEDGDMELDNWR